MFGLGWCGWGLGPWSGTVGGVMSVSWIICVTDMLLNCIPTRACFKTEFRPGQAVKLRSDTGMLLNCVLTRVCRKTAS